MQGPETTQKEKKTLQDFLLHHRNCAGRNLSIIQKKRKDSFLFLRYPRFNLNLQHKKDLSKRKKILHLIMHPNRATYHGSN